MIIKLKILIALLLLGCLLDVPYGYFQFVKIAGFAGFVYLSYNEFTKKREITAIILALCAILLNPIFKIYFKRYTWNIIDLIIAVGLMIWVVSDAIKSNKIKKTA